MLQSVSFVKNQADNCSQSIVRYYIHCVTTPIAKHNSFSDFRVHFFASCAPNSALLNHFKGQKDLNEKITD